MMFHIPGLTTSVLLIAILSLSSSLAIGADDYPSRPIKLMVGASPGGTTDTMARATLRRMRSPRRRPTATPCWSASPAIRSTRPSIPSCRSIR